MVRTRRACAVAGAAALLAGVTFASGKVQASAMTEPTAPLPGSAVPFTAGSQAIGNAPGAGRLRSAGFADVRTDDRWGLATPLVAGMVAAAQQGQRRPFGFINPVIYRLAGTSALTDALPLSDRSPVGFRGVFCGVPDCPFQALITSDDQSTSMFGYTGQVTLGGYDNMTGLGTPNAAALVNALRKMEG